MREKIEPLYAQYVRGVTLLQPLLLLGIRGYWGYQFALTGLGKLNNVERVTGYFESLGIPLPELNVYMAGGTELFGGILLFLGLGGRLITVPLIFTMLVAYGTADKEALDQFFSNPDAFVTAAPFLFLLSSTIIWLYGSGPLSVDGLIWRFMKSEAAEAKAVATAQT